ncbi:MAG: carbohydrate deacetylase [bacterium]
MFTDGQLIVNADDFGLHPAVNEAVARGVEQGVISSASLMATESHYSDAVDIARDLDVDVGLHACFTNREPVSEPGDVESLVDDQGTMPDHFPQFVEGYLLGRIRRDHIRRELRAQCKKILSSNLNVNHLNSHEHLHMLPGLFRMFMELCDEYDIGFIRTVNEILLPGWWKQTVVPLLGIKGLTWWNKRSLRGKSPRTNDSFGGVLWQGVRTQSDRDRFMQLIKGQTVEWGVHVATRKLTGPEGYDKDREFVAMLDWLCSDQFKETLRKHDIELTSIQQLLNKSGE